MDINIIQGLIALLIGWIADRIWGDPHFLPHPIVGFGKLISWGEKRFNNGRYKMLKGALFSILLIVACFVVSSVLLKEISSISVYLNIVFSAVLIFFCLAGKTLIEEVKNVFFAVESSVEDGRIQVASIVGRDTSELSEDEIKTASLETLSENLSDGVVAPLFWFMLLGVPGMLAYKMINTLDSMIGYKNDRFKQFGCWAARIDDIANYIPARLTALLMILVSRKTELFSFVYKYGKKHISPNSGYPEATLAGILNCRFGGSHNYFGKQVIKPYIGENERSLNRSDMEIAVSINIKTELLMILIVICTVLASKLYLL